MRAIVPPTGNQLISMIAEGVFAKFPRLKVVAIESDFGADFMAFLSAAGDGGNLLQSALCWDAFVCH